MICPKCGKKLIQGKNFCGYCGNKIDMINVASNAVQEIYPTVRPRVTPETMPEPVPEVVPEMVQEVIPNIESEPTYDASIHEKKGFSPLLIVIPVLVLLVIACSVTALTIIKNSDIAAQKSAAATATKSSDTKSAAASKDANTSTDANSNTSSDTTSDSSSTAVAKDSDYFFSNSDKAYLVEADLKAISKDQLAIARNEIYARHGYVFTTQPFLDYFKNKSWYTPNPAYKGGDETLNKFEIANIKLIKKLEAGDTSKVTSTKVTSEAAALKILQAKVTVDSHDQFLPVNTSSFSDSYYCFRRVYISDDGTKEEGDIGNAIFVEKKTGDVYVLDLDKDPNAKTLKKY